MALYARVSVSDVTYWVDRPYEYRVPEALASAAVPGVRVTIPFSRGGRRATGVILSVSETPEYAPEKIKDILGILDESPVLTHEQLDLALWMRERFFCTVFEAIKAILPVGLWFDSEGKRNASDKQQKCLNLLISPEEAFALAEERKARSPKQAAVLRLMSAVGEAILSDVRAMSGASGESIKALVKEGLCDYSFREQFRRPVFKKGRAKPMLDLSPEQRRVFDGLYELLVSGEASCSLLHGVTGSGKTSVYIRLIHECLKLGRSVILLVPEIALTPQMLETFSSYFGEEVAVLHSSLSVSERYDEWKRLKEGKAHLCIGTRSAVFAPLENPGLIIIDEEQEDTYKSENSPRYHARDIAKYRCVRSGAMLVLGSATPNLESRYYAEKGRYHYFSLSERYNGMALPAVSIVDMKRELKAGNMSSVSSFLRGELEKNIKKGEQSILFLNRRGSSRLVTCAECGYVFGCPNCSVSMTYHSSNNKLQCHYCGYRASLGSACPDCGGRLIFTGDGTEKIEEQLHEFFPGTDIVRVDADTVSAAGGHEPIFEKFRRENIPIMLGTQMVAKGHNFENVTLVGVLAADQSLYSGDWRSGEKTFSLITQVIGRSGRADKPGRAIIQTFTPENQVVLAAAGQNYDSFYESEITLRRIQDAPPFAQLFTLSFIGKDENAVLRCALEVKKRLSASSGAEKCCEVLGPTAYSVVKVAGSFRYKLILKGPDTKEIRSLVSGILYFCNGNKDYRGVSVFADINPNMG
ncbi:MAG: primosomal protein N' [Oscillospiraceae bacterium]|nr:primosomal protein N' [Oscillospiraceae bacterium]